MRGLLRHRLRWVAARGDRRTKAAVLLGAGPFGVAAGVACAQAGAAPLLAAAVGLGLAGVVLTAALAVLVPAAPVDGLATVRRVRELLTPLDLDVRESAPVRVNLLVSTVDLDHFFGAHICAFNLARRLAEHGQAVRIVTTERQPALPRSWRDRLAAYEGLGDGVQRLDFAFGRDGDGPLEISPRDGFVATTSWTARLAHAAARTAGRTGFVHLIQEYDPLAFPQGSLAALAREAYGLPHHAVFSTEQLRDYFRRHRLGVFAGEDGDGRSAVVRNAITPVGPVTERDVVRRLPRLLFYARPEPHACRNMFELGLVALAALVEDRAFGPEWSFAGIGSVRPVGPVELPDGRRLDLLPRGDQRAYARTLATGTVGLSLIDTPHPSLPPIEMAAAGLLVVTNTFENKDGDALRAISPNLLAVEPTFEGLTSGMRQALARHDDVAARARGSHVDWPSSWDDAWSDELVARIVGWLGR